MIFKCVLEYTIKNVKESQKGLELNGTHQFLVYVDVNIFRENTNTTKKHRNSVTHSLSLSAVELITRKTKPTFTSDHQNAGQISNVMLKMLRNSGNWEQDQIKILFTQRLRTD